MNYKKNYEDYIRYVKTLDRKKEKRSRNGIINENYIYYERHHIEPTCLGGPDTEDNTVFLTAREHFLAHYLLTKVYPNNNKIIFAFMIFSMQKNPTHLGLRYMNSNLFSSIREQSKLALSETLKSYNSNISIRKQKSISMSGINNSMFGKTPWNKGIKRTEEERKKISDGVKTQYNNLSIDEKLVRNIRAQLKVKKYWEDHLDELSEYRDKLSKANSGLKNPMAGKSIYSTWIENYGIEEADRKKLELSKKLSENNKRKNPMAGRSLYSVWLNKYGKEEADRREHNRSKKRAETIKRNLEKKQHIGC